MIVATTDTVPLLVAINADILPEPAPARPMLVVLFVHVYAVVPPVLFVVKVTAVVSEPSQTT